MRVLPCGDRALLVEVDDLSAVLALDAALQRASIPGVVDIVPAARTVLLRFGATGDLTSARRRIAALAVGPSTPPEDGVSMQMPVQMPVQMLVQIPVHYDGADLAEVARTVALTPTELIAAHTGTDWTAAFCGFAPGFAYLTGGDERLVGIGRRATPRTRVPAGSVALAAGFSAVYPGPSPGGWNLLGRTAVQVFDPLRDPAALLAPGTRVRFVDERSREELWVSMSARAKSYGCR